MSPHVKTGFYHNHYFRGQIEMNYQFRVQTINDCIATFYIFTLTILQNNNGYTRLTIQRCRRRRRRQC